LLKPVRDNNTLLNERCNKGLNLAVPGSSRLAIERPLWRKLTLRIEISEAIAWSCIVSVDCFINTGCPLFERVKFVTRLLDDEKESSHCNNSSDRIICHPGNANHKEGRRVESSIHSIVWDPKILRPGVARCQWERVCPDNSFSR